MAARVAGTERMVVAAGTAIRVGGVALLGYSVPITWAHQPHPGWSALLAVVLAAESTLVVAGWLWQRRAAPLTLALDVPTGVLALLAGATLSADGAGGWVFFSYPYTIFVSVALGLCGRSIWPVALAGAAWTAAFVVGLTVFAHNGLQETLSLAPGYLLNPLIGWLCARAFRRRAAALEAARVAAVAQATELAVAGERARHARALHDRVLQTMETLARSRTIPDEALRARVVQQAAWLRRFIETGLVDQEEDLAAGLAAAARAAGRAGIRVQLNDARLRIAPHGGGLAPRQRDTLVQAVHQAISSVTGADGSVVVRAVPDDTGVLVTVLATGPGGAPQPDEIAELMSRLAAIGGTLAVDSMPYLELWVPARS
jgi:signal transduction histidine kinase